jgi:hypothetical protein
MNARHIHAGGSVAIIRETAFYVVYSRRDKVLLTWVNDPLSSGIGRGS